MKKCLILMTLCAGFTLPLFAFPGMDEFQHAVRAISPQGGILGVHLNEVSAEQVKELKLPAEKGAMVISVAPDSAAEAAGVLANDVFVEWDGVLVRSVAQLQRLVKETVPKREVGATVIRDGSPLTLTLHTDPREELSFSRQFEEWKDEFQLDDNLRKLIDPDWSGDEEQEGDADEVSPLKAPKSLLQDGGGPKLGVLVQELEPQLAEYFGASDGGVLVASVQKGSLAEKSGMLAGDIIYKINDKVVRSPRDVTHSLAIAEEDEVKIILIRAKAELVVQVNLKSN